MQLNVLILPGDGIGVEVTREAVRVLETVASKFGHTLRLTEGLLGGIAIHKTGTPFPDETARLAVEADATLMGAVGLPEFDNWPPEKRPERGLLGIRKTLGVFANLRPVRSYPALLDSSPQFRKNIGKFLGAGQATLGLVFTLYCCKKSAREEFLHYAKSNPLPLKSMKPCSALSLLAPVRKKRRPLAKVSPGPWD